VEESKVEEMSAERGQLASSQHTFSNLPDVHVDFSRGSNLVEAKRRKLQHDNGNLFVHTFELL
jgi:hypothetical protein